VEVEQRRREIDEARETVDADPARRRERIRRAHDDRHAEVAVRERAAVRDETALPEPDAEGADDDDGRVLPAARRQAVEECASAASCGRPPS
jgi:hypothetical protein